jgi:hypothetical protein
MRTYASPILRRLARARVHYGGRSSALKSTLLASLERSSLRYPREVLRLHEILCLLRAYPDDAPLLSRVERMLRRFPTRPDLRRHRGWLANTGIAGTEIQFRFYAETALWIALRHPESLLVNWQEFSRAEELEPYLPMLVHYAETPGLDEWDFSVRAWIRRLKGAQEGDGAFLARRFAALKADSFIRERVYDQLDIPLRLLPGKDSPSRSHARLEGSRVHFVRQGISRKRPELPEDLLRRPLAIRPLTPAQARPVIDLAREAMITRQRDLDLFSYANPADVTMVEWEDGLQFACLGALPERRLLLEAVYAFLTLKNGVPLGYVLVSALFGSSEIAYNVFETFRGGEAGRIYGRVLATARHLFGSDAFTIFPYQLGHGNEEAIRSGAWWFYQKIGFRPRARAALRIMRRELARMRRDPSHRSSPATLRTLARHNLYYFLGPRREDVMGSDFLPEVGLRISRYLARSFGSDREAAAAACSSDAARKTGLRTLKGFSPQERLAWERWSPLICLLEGVERWSGEEKRSLVRIVRAKGGRSETDFARRFDRHARLRGAILRLGGHPGKRGEHH